MCVHGNEETHLANSVAYSCLCYSFLTTMELYGTEEEDASGFDPRLYINGFDAHKYFTSSNNMSLSHIRQENKAVQNQAYKHVAGPCKMTM